MNGAYASLLKAAELTYLPYTVPVVDHLEESKAKHTDSIVFNAAYRLCRIGYLTQESSRRTNQAEKPWWVVVAVLTYVESPWIHNPASGCCWWQLRLRWYGAVTW